MKSENSASPSSASASVHQPLIRLGPSFLITAAIVVIGSAALCAKATPFSSGLFFVPFAFGPLVITVTLCFALPSASAQRLLTISSVLYAVWFGYVYAQVFYINPDPQSPIAFLFIGVYAVPVLVVFWIAAGVAQWLSIKQSTNNPMPPSGEAGRSDVESPSSPSGDP